MSKKVATLPTWFWPEKVPRTTGVPPLFLDEALVDKWAEERPDVPAIVETTKVLTYAALREQVNRSAALIAKHIPSDTKRRVLIDVSSRAKALLLLLSALKARCVTYCVSFADESSVARFGPDVIVTDGVHQLGAPAVRLGADDVLAAPDGDGVADSGEPKSPALALLTERRSFALHSHYGLLGGALALTAFMEMPEGVTILLTSHPGTWLGLYTALCALYLGGSLVVCEEDNEREIGEAVRRHRVEAVFLTPELAAYLPQHLGRSARATFRNSCKWLFMSVAVPLSVKQRKGLSNLAGRLALTIYGTAETGPVIASHPSWCVNESVGIPLTNSELRPVDPVSREAIEVPWELLEYAAIEVKATHMMTGYDDPKETAERVRRRWFFTGRLAMMDGNGLYYLLP